VAAASLSGALPMLSSEKGISGQAFVQPIYESAGQFGLRTSEVVPSVCSPAALGELFGFKPTISKSGTKAAPVDKEEPKKTRPVRTRVASRKRRAELANSYSARKEAKKAVKPPSKKRASTTKRRSKASSNNQRTKKPKRPKTAYNFFQLAIRDELWREITSRKKGPKDRVALNEKVARVIGKRWKALTPSKRSQYQTLADHDKKRYARENSAYIAALRVSYDDNTEKSPQPADPEPEENENADASDNSDEVKSSSSTPTVESGSPNNEEQDGSCTTESENNLRLSFSVGRPSGFPDTVENSLGFSNLLASPALTAQTANLFSDIKLPPTGFDADCEAECEAGMHREGLDIEDVHDVLELWDF